MITSKNKRWYKMIVRRAHVGESQIDSMAYVYVYDVIGALNKYKIIRGIKRNIRRGDFPDISVLADEEISNLEKEIENSEYITLSKAKKSWYLKPI